MAGDVHLHFPGITHLPWEVLFQSIQHVAETLECIATLLREGNHHMSEIQDKLTQALDLLTNEDSGLAALGTSLNGVATDVQSLKDQLAQGGVTPEVMALVDSILERSQANKAAVDALGQQASDLDATT